MKILITGASGFLGSHLVGQWAKTAQVYAGIYTKKNTWRLDYFANQGLSFETVSLDVTDSKNVAEVIGLIQPDVIINCAAYGVYPHQTSFRKLIDTNIKGAVNLYELANQHSVERFVQIGSCFEYGHQTKPVLETDTAEPSTPYGISKLSGNLMLQKMGDSSQTQLLIARVFGLWGVLEDSNRLVPLLISSTTKSPLKVTLGEQIRDYSHVTDMANWIIQLAQIDGLHQEIINLGSGIPVKLNDFMNIVLANWDSSLELDFGAIPYRDNEMMYLVADTYKLDRLIPNRQNHLTETLFKDRLDQLKKVLIH